MSTEFIRKSPFQIVVLGVPDQATETQVLYHDPLFMAENADVARQYALAKAVTGYSPEVVARAEVLVRPFRG